MPDDLFACRIQGSQTPRHVQGVENIVSVFKQLMVSLFLFAERCFRPLAVSDLEGKVFGPYAHLFPEMRVQPLQFIACPEQPGLHIEDRNLLFLWRIHNPSAYAAILLEATRVFPRLTEKTPRVFN